VRFFSFLRQSIRKYEIRLINLAYLFLFKKSHSQIKSYFKAISKKFPLNLKVGTVLVIS